MVWVRLSVYFYKKNDTFYFSRSIPSDLQHRFKKREIEVSLRTKSESKVAKSAAALSDRLERFWDNFRMEIIHLGDLDLSLGILTCHWRPKPKDGLPVISIWLTPCFYIIGGIFIGSSNDIMSISDAVFMLVFRGGILALFALMELPLTQRPDTKMTDCS